MRAAAAAGTNRLATELGHIVVLEAAWGREALVAAVARAAAYRRFKTSDVRSILEAGAGEHLPTADGDALVVDLPAAPVSP